VSTISKPTITKDVTINEVSVVYRCFLDAGGVGLGGLTPLLKITDTVGTNVTLVENTDWRKVERSNIGGDYEIIIGISNLPILGQYTIEVDSQDPAVGKVVTHFTLNGIYGMINDGAPTTTSFTTNLSSSTLDFYKDSFLLPITGVAAGCGPKKVTGYSTGKVITINALPTAPSNGDAFYLIRF